MSNYILCANNDYSLWLHSDDEVKGTVNLYDLVGVGIFSAWKDIEIFKRISIDPIKETVSWGDGISLDSDMLHEYLVSKASGGYAALKELPHNLRKEIPNNF